MESRIDILNELKTLSPVLAGIEKLNVFTVPAGYFETLGQDVLLAVKEEGGSLLNTITGQTAMEVPQGYFENLAGNILNKIKEQDTAAAELKDLSPVLHSMQSNNVFTTPQGYFENLAGNILNKIKEQNTAAAELNELSPLLQSIKGTNVFTVPQGYFETLPTTVLNKVQPQQAKVVTMQRRTTTILKYAIAAVFTGVIALGVYKFTATVKPATINYSGVMQTNVDGELAKISDADILNFLTKEGVDVEAAVAVTQMQDKIDEQETNTDKAESNEIDDLLNQLDDNKQMN